MLASCKRPGFNPQYYQSSNWYNPLHDITVNLKLGKGSKGLGVLDPIKKLSTSVPLQALFEGKKRQIKKNTSKTTQEFTLYC